MKLVVPREYDGYSNGQQHIDDDEFAELLGADMVQANWNVDGNKLLGPGIGTGMRETCFVPTYEETKIQNAKEDEFFYVHHDRESSPFNNKMRTIKEEEEGHYSGGSDTGYFSNEEGFNDRSQFNSDEEEEFESRKQ